LSWVPNGAIRFVRGSAEGGTCLVDGTIFERPQAYGKALVMTRLRQLALLACLSLSSSGVVSCGGAQPHPEYDVLSPPDERTAITWISRAFRKEGYEVESGRKVKISSTVTLTVDVSAIDGRWSVVWLRADEQQELKGKL